MIKIISALAGFLAGAGVGIAINCVAGLSGYMRIIVIFACAVAFGGLLFFLYRLGVLVLTVAVASLAVLMGMGLGAGRELMAALGVALVVGVLAAVFVEPGAILITSVSGGLCAGINIASFAGRSELIGVGIGAALAVLGMLVQFFLHAKKIGKKERVRSQKAKEKGSMESEVEKARLLLDDDEDVDE